ncbi:MAG: hypothetical protein ACREJU_07635, partial [Nitrospiraceae bacterium]
MTKSNIGIDVDSKPPTAEISIARKEVVIAPTFAGGQTPTVAASFRSNWKGLLGLFADVSGTFSGGDAAATMARWAGDPGEKDPRDIQSSTVCLNEKPVKDAFGKSFDMPGPQDVRPFIFGTDTSFGLKVAWSGLTAQVPDTVRLGYNRKEMAWAPVFVEQESCQGGTFKADMPSFLATIDNNVEVGTMEKGGGEHIQYFATGLAAKYLTLKPEIRQTMLERLDPQAAKKLETFERF